MKTKITKENYEEIMFNLLEGEYNSENEEIILFDIERDSFLNFEWKQFLKTKFIEDIKPYEIDEVEFWKKLHQKEETKIVIISSYNKKFVMAIAASILLFITIGYFLQTEKKGLTLDNTIKLKTIIADTFKLNTLTKNVKKSLYTPLKNNIKYPKIIEFNTKDSEIIAHLNNYKDVYKDTLANNNIANISPQIKQEKLKNNKYKVAINTESINLDEFALMQDYDIMKINPDEESKINAYLKNKKTSLASLLKNTKVIFKKKDNKIYLLAYGDNYSSIVWEIAN